MTAPKFTPWKVGGRVGSTARDGLVGLYAIDREKPNKYQGNAVAYAPSLDNARMCAAAPELYAALERLLEDVPAMTAQYVTSLHPGAWDRYLAAREQARAAIGKAVGK